MVVRLRANNCITPDRLVFSFLGALSFGLVPNLCVMMMAFCHRNCRVFERARHVVVASRSFGHRLWCSAMDVRRCRDSWCVIGIATVGCISNKFVSFLDCIPRGYGCGSRVTVDGIGDGSDRLTIHSPEVPFEKRENSPSLPKSLFFGAETFPSGWLPLPLVSGAVVAGRFEADVSCRLSR